VQLLVFLTSQFLSDHSLPAELRQADISFQRFTDIFVRGLRSRCTVTNCWNCAS